ncbi:MAG: AMIN domain-containing protein, partial [Myxococcales bacterium]|nr:AMIN domain-containing protein [Myxococcales bacterium]
MRSSAALGLALAVCLTHPARAQERVQLNTISRIEVKGGTVEIHGSNRPSFTSFTMADPPRLVVDISEAVFAEVPSEIQVNNGVVTAVKTASYGSAAATIARVLVGFEKDVETEMSIVGGTRLVVKVIGAQGPAVADAKAAQEKEPTAKAEQERLSREKAEKEAAAKVEQDRLVREKAEKEAAAKAEQERLARNKAEKEAAAKAEQERLARERADKEAAAKAEQERLARERADQEAAAKAEQERLARERADQEAAAKAEQERLARERA